MSNNPVIFIPGFLGSALDDYYALEPRATWDSWSLLHTSLTGPDFHELALDAEGKVDAALDIVNRARSLLSAPYAKLVTALRSRRAAPVYVFPYDWRYSTSVSGQLLSVFVERVRHKMAAAQTGWQGKIDFVAHSFGGLVFRAFLGSAPGPQSFGQVVLITVPHQGCLDAAEAMIRGKSTLLEGRKELRKLARNLPSVYELLPTFAGAAKASNGSELNLFQLESWQDNVTASSAAGPELSGFDVTQPRLDAARKQLSKLRRVEDVVPPRDSLTLYGGDADSTLASILVGPKGTTQRWFDFDNARKGRGDGLILETSAKLPGVPCVRLSKADASIFGELEARLAFHGFICGLDETQTIVSRFLDGQRGADSLLPLSLPRDRYEP